MIPTSIDGTDITGATIDGTDVQEITVDGQTVFTAGPTPAPDRLYYVMNNGDMVQLDLGSKFSLSNVTETGRFSFGGNTTDVWVGDDGTKLYGTNINDDKIYQWDLNTPYDINSRSNQITQNQTRAHTISISADGVHCLTSNYDNELRYGILTTPYDVTSFNLQHTIQADTTFGSNNFADADYVNQGNKLLVGGYFDAVTISDLTTPYDLSTVTNVQFSTLSGSSEEKAAKFMSEDGTKLIHGNGFNQEIREFDLSTPYDINSRSNVLNTISTNAFVQGIHMV